MADFFQQYFIDPITSGSGYNVYNTLAYAIILIAAVFVTYKLLKKMKIAIDDRFVLGVLPYVILGGLLRALEDSAAISFVFKTPVIYIVIFLFALGGLLAGKLVERFTKKSYHLTWAGIGIVAVLIGLSQVAVQSPFALAAIVALSIFWAVLLVIAKKISDKMGKKFFSWENTSLLAVHMFDATTTFVALTYFPYFEQHVLPSFLIGLFGPAVMFILKFAVVGAVLYVLDKEMAKEKEKRKFIKLVILILGLAPGLRNFFRLVMGV